MKKIFDIVIGMTMLFGFWGVLYPEITLTNDMYSYNEVKIEENKDNFSDFYDILEADEIVIKSKVIEYLLFKLE